MIDDLVLLLLPSVMCMTVTQGSWLHECHLSNRPTPHVPSFDTTHTLGCCLTLLYLAVYLITCSRL